MQPFHYPSSSRPATPDSPRFEKESHMGSDLAMRQMRQEADEAVKAYEETRDRCVYVTSVMRVKLILDLVMELSRQSTC
jgi:hypothetical protein